MSELVLHETQGAIRLLTLNRPEKLNALSFALIDELQSQLDLAEKDYGIRAVVLTGAGKLAFSAGADICDFAESIARGPEWANSDFVGRGQRLTSSIENFPKPIIIAVNGLAYGGGCEIVEAAHLTIAVEDALFSKPEIKLSMPSTFGGTQRLPRLAGRKRALELLLTGEPFTARHALEIGLINRIVHRDQLLPAAFEMAERIIRHSPQSVSAILAATTRGLSQPISEGLKIEADQFRRLVGSEALAEGLRNWLGRKRRRMKIQ